MERLQDAQQFEQAIASATPVVVKFLQHGAQIAYEWISLLMKSLPLTHNLHGMTSIATMCQTSPKRTTSWAFRAYLYSKTAKKSPTCIAPMQKHANKSRSFCKQLKADK